MSGQQLWEVGPGKCKMGCSRAVATGTATEVDGFPMSVGADFQAVKTCQD